jgi:DMSO/TMAO reductase YedYZ heme-binding membrane subunit
VLGVTDGAVASSTTLRRRWTVAGEARHHLIDPATGRPSTSRRTFATVVAGYAWAADVLAKALILDDERDPFALLRTSGAEALIVDDTRARRHDVRPRRVHEDRSVNQLTWDVARASGLVGWALLSAATLWGLALSTKVFGKRPRPNWILDLHRMLGALALVFTAVHVGAILADQYIHFSLTSVLVPFASAWRPGAVAFGVVGLYLLVAIELTSLLRARVPKKLWRRVHYASFPLFIAATLHGLTAGTDTTRRVALYVAGSVAVAIGALVAVRAAAAYGAKPYASSPRHATAKVGVGSGMPFSSTEPRSSNVNCLPMQSSRTASEATMSPGSACAQSRAAS